MGNLDSTNNSFMYFTIEKQLPKLTNTNTSFKGILFFCDLEESTKALQLPLLTVRKTSISKIWLHYYNLSSSIQKSSYCHIIYIGENWRNIHIPM